MGKSNGNRYSEEFKQEAVKLVLKNKQSIAEVCRNLGVSRNAMGRCLATEADSHDDDKVRMHQITASTVTRPSETYRPASSDGGSISDRQHDEKCCVIL